MLQCYMCGGTGANVGKQISDLDIGVCFIDTSSSNLKNVPDDAIFLTPDMDGGGKNRRLVYENFEAIADDVLIRFKPSDSLNVVVSSLSGGSGSVIAPLLTKHLIKQGYNVIVIGIDSRSSTIELNNTVKALKTYKAVSDTIKRCISLFFIENSSRREADKRAIYFINLLSLLVNKAHTAEFDVTDLSNFINFDRVTDNKPTVGIIDINPNETVTPEKNTGIVSTVLVTTNQDSTIKPAIPEYLSTCIVTEPSYKNADLRMDNYIGALNALIEGLEEEIKTLTDNKKINKIKEVDVTGQDDNGMVL